jgi:hypothetical protein
LALNGFHHIALQKVLFESNKQTRKLMCEAAMTTITEVLERTAELLHRHKLPLAYAGSAAAWLFSALQVTQCNFLGHHDANRIGLFSREYLDQKGEHLGCIRYSQSEVDDFDSMIRAGRAFGVVTLLYMTMVVASTSYCILMAPLGANNIWRANKYLLAAAALSQMLTLLAAGSKVCNVEKDDHCELVGVGILGIFNIVVLIILCAAFASLDPPKSRWLRVVESAGARVNTSPGGSNVIQRLSAHNPACFRFLFTGLVLIATVMSAVTLNRCTFLMVDAAGFGPTNIASGLGFYTQAIQVQGSFVGCVAYPSFFSFDRPFKSARFFATLSVILSSVSFLAAALSLFRRDLQLLSWTLLRILLPVSGFCLALGSVALRSDNCSLQGTTTCRLGSAGVLAMFLVVLLLFLSAVVWSQPQPESAIFCIGSSSTAAKGQASGSDVEQQSSNGDTVVIGNPRMLHKQEPIMEEDEEKLDCEEECQSGSKETPNKVKLLYKQKRSSNGSLSDTTHSPGRGSTVKRNFLDGDDDDNNDVDESSVLSAPSTISQAVTYDIDYIGDVKTTTKIISTRAGVLSETTRTEHLEDCDDDDDDGDGDSISCSLSIP